VKYSSLQLSGLRLSVLLKQARFVTRVHAPLCAATFPVLSDYRIIRVFRVSLLPLPTSSALSAVCNMQANCNPVPQFIPVSNMLKYTILLQNLLLLWNTKGVNTNIQGVPLATEPGISLIILPLMRILQRNLKRT